MSKLTSSDRPESASQSRAAKLTYWIPTVLLSLMMTAGGLGDALLSASAVEVMRQLGYPDYFTRLLGVAKVLGVAALLLPVPRVLREWAYAGFTFDVLGATVSILAVGGAPLGALAPLTVLVAILLSYRGWKQRLAHAEERTHSAPEARHGQSVGSATPALIG